MPRGRTKTFTSKTKGETTIESEKTQGKNVENNKKEIKIKTEPLDEEQQSTSGAAPDLTQFKFQKKPHIKIEFEKDSLSKQEPGLWEPPNWREFLLNLRNMRSNNDAPVDTMGCHMAMDENAAPEVMRFQSLIALMLSSQTKDQVTFAAMERLRARGLTVDNVLDMSDDELGKLIYPVGFWKTKVKYIKKTTQILKEQYNGDIPDSVEKLCKLTGVGPKMAHICMKVAWNKITGIGVDTHVHRISNRIGWVKKATPTPEDTRKSLQSWLPFDLWSEVNHLMVGFGQTICTPISPICNECLNRDICPSSGKGRKSPNKKTPVKQEDNSEADEEEHFEVKKKIPVLKLEPVQPQIKKKATPKKEIQERSDTKPQKDDLLVTKHKSRKTSPKNRIANKEVPDCDAVIDDFIQPSEPLRKIKMDVTNENDEKRSPLKRKSPRNKETDNVKLNKKSSDDVVVDKKRTRAAKK